MNLSIQVDDYVSPHAAKLPKVAVEDIIYVEKYEMDSYGHWLFGGDSDSLKDKVNGKVLTMQAGATTQPIYNTNNIQLSASFGNALLTDLSDTDAQDITICGVFKVSTTTFAPLMGNLVPNSLTTTSGFGFFASDNVSVFTIKPLIAASTGGFTGMTAGPLQQQSYFFISASVNKAAKKIELYTRQMGAGLSAERTWTSTYEASLNKIAIGNGYYNGNFGNINVAEAIIYNKALTISEIELLSLRTQLRLNNRGITF